MKEQELIEAMIDDRVAQMSKAELLAIDGVLAVVYESLWADAKEEAEDRSIEKAEERRDAR